MFKHVLLFLALCLGTVFSRVVNFKVIAFGSKVQVYIDGKKYTLTLDKNDEILYVGKISNAPDSKFKYYYVVDGVKENFERTCTKNTKSTYLEFFGRKDTVKELPNFSYPGEKWKKSIGRTDLFDQSYIPTIHITGNDVDKMMKKPTNKYFYFDKVTFYLKNGKKVATNVKANPKNWIFSKFQIKMELNEPLFGRNILKLRNGGEDPLNMRQLIYGNIIEQLGIPALKSVMVRVYYNKKPAGFYTLQDEAFSDGFIKAEFHGDPSTGEIKKEKYGTPFDCAAGAEYDYSSDLGHYSQFKSSNKKASRKKVQALAKAIEQLNTKNAKAVKNFEKQWFDIESFHKAMAMEFLTTDWDGYWYSNANFASYDVPQESTSTTFKHYFITQDHDETFGVGIYKGHYNDIGYEYPRKMSYKTMINVKNLAGHGSEKRVLIDKFIASSPDLQKRFEKTLASIVQYVFNPVAFKEVVDVYHARYYPEMEWDFSFKREYTPSASVGANAPDYEFKHFKNGLTKKAGGLQWGLYTWVEMRAELIKEELCVTWKGDKKPNKKCVKNY